MPELAAFTICDNVQNVSLPTGQMFPQISSPCIALRPQYIPSNFSFGIVIGIRNANISASNNLCLEIFGPSGEITYNSGGLEIPADHGKSSLPEQYHGFVIILDVRNMPIAIEGCYTVKITLNGSLVSTQSLPIYKGDSPIE